MKLFYHGTGADNLDSILDNNLDNRFSLSINWSCSSDVGSYFWNPEKFDKEEYFNPQEMAKQRAAESAEFSLYNAKNCRRLVLEVDLEGMEIEQDNSCENMHEAVFCLESISPNRIKTIWRDKEDLSLFKFYFLTLGERMNLFNKEKFSEIEEKTLKILQKIDTCEIFEYLSEKVEEMEIIYKNNQIN